MSEVLLPDEFESLLTPLAELKPDPINARAHDERNLEAITDSLKMFGWRSVIVARSSDKMVLAGHGRLEAAKRLGETHGPVVFVEATDEQARAYALADNRTGELARWDFNVLQQVIQTVGDIEVPGFRMEEIDALLGAPLLRETTEEEIEAINEQGRQKAVQRHTTVVLRVRVPKQHAEVAKERLEAIASDCAGEVL